MASRATSRLAPPLEHRILVTVTLCLLAFGAVMVFSASSSTGVLGGSSYGTSEFFMYLLAAGLGLIAMRVGERRGLALLNGPTVRLLLFGSFALLLAVMIPGIGRDINGARRWFAFGPIQFQPSELMKLVLVLYVARYLADHPRRLRGFRQAVAPIAVIVAPACLLIAAEPDLGTMLVVVFTIGALLLAAGMPLRYMAAIAGAVVFVVLLMVLASSYQRARLLSFLHPWAASCKSGPCYQAVQGQIAVGSGGIFGVGLGNSVQKAYYLPEAQTDFILAVIGEELGVLGIFGVACLYGMIAFAGLRTARRAATRYAKLLASGLTSLILCQGVLNIFVVLGIAPLTGVPLPFISYAPTNLCMMLVAVGLLLGIARPPARELRSVDDGGDSRSAADWRDNAADPDRRGRHGRARRTGTGGRRRAAG
jgi:cell division protein FtsW